MSDDDKDELLRNLPEIPVDPFHDGKTDEFKSLQPMPTILADSNELRRLYELLNRFPLKPGESVQLIGDETTKRLYYALTPDRVLHNVSKDPN